MRKNILLYSFLFFVFIFIGCKKILKQDVQGSYTPENFFTSDANAQEAVNNAYKYLSFNSGATNAIWVLGDLASDDAVKGGSGAGDQPDYQNINQFNILTTNSAVEAVWQNYYNGVFASNVVIDGLTGNNNISATMQAQGIAQATFLRAYYYFILTICYGDIPLHLHAVSGTDAQTPALSQDTIYAQIERDCIAAAAVLPHQSDLSASQLGQATKGAALALLAKVYLFNTDLPNNYALAASAAQKVEAEGYQLTGLYSDNFNSLTKNNTEQIFTVNHITGTLGLGNELNQWFAPRLSTFNGYGFFLPTASLVNSYEVDNGVADPRLNYAIAQSGQPYFDATYDPTWSSTGYCCKKMCQPLSEVPAATKGVGSVNYEALRLGDILLVEAEALNESGQSSAALTPLNKVRERARNSYIYDNTLSGYPNVPNGLLPDITVTDQSTLRDIIRNERRSECALEFHRFFDIIRYGKDYANAALLSGAPNFDYDKNKFFPIPQSERDANPNLFK